MNKKECIKLRRRFFKNLEVIREIEDHIQSTEYKISTVKKLDQWHLLNGKLEALKEYYNRPIRDVYKAITSTNDELKGLDSNDELFEMHKSYLKGYKSGCVEILEIGRNYDFKNKKIKVLIYTQEKSLQDILTILFESVGIINDANLSHEASVYISTDIDKLNDLATKTDCFKFIFTVRPLSSKSHEINSNNSEKIMALKHQLSEKYEPIDTIEDNFYADIKLLNNYWKEASYVYIDSLVSIEKVFTVMLRSLRQI